MFGFALTFLVISLEVPKRFVELQVRMQGFVGFAVCFVMLMLVWHTQYIYFRRYALDDRVSFLLKAALLFVVALNTLEIHETRGAVWENVIMLGIGASSLALAAVNQPIWAGMIYMLIGPVRTVRGRTHGRQRELLRAAE